MIWCANWRLILPMIRLIDAIPCAALDAFCAGDAFGTRIAARAHSGGAYADFWLQERNGEVTAALSRQDGVLELSAAKNADSEELRQFLCAVDWQSLHCADTARYIQEEPTQSGTVFRFVHSDAAGEMPGRLTTEDARAVYALLAESGFALPGSYGDWLADIALRLRGGTAVLYGVRAGDGLCFTASILFQTENAAFLGSIATQKQARGQGIAAFALTALARQLQAEGKRAELFCAPALSVFYQKIGFQACGTWSQYHKTDEV